jgi:hypothetical protein
MPTRHVITLHNVAHHHVAPLQVLPVSCIAQLCQQSAVTHDLNLLTPWSTVLEKLTSFQTVKKFPAFYGTRRFLTAFTSARQLTLP